MKATMKMVGCLSGLLILNAVAAEFVVSDVTVRQRWPWSRLVDIEYVLDCDPSETADITITAREGTQTLELSADSLSGDLFDVKKGHRRIVWDPLKSAYTNELLTRFQVELSAMATPAYLIVDISESSGGERVVYVTDKELASGLYGACVTNIVNGVQTIAWMDVTNHSTYATDKLVLRRIPAGSFEWGASAAYITNAIVSKPYYIGVFAITQKQWSLIYPGLAWPSSFSLAECRDTRPVENISYQMVRGLSATINDYPGVSPVDENSFVGLLRARSGLEGFELPTEAQWAYAFQAGEGNVNYGIEVLNEIGRNGNNGGLLNGSTISDALKPSLGTTNGTARVGSYIPNNFGLYDMYGNVYELILDWSVLHGSSPTLVNYFAGGIDPEGLQEIDKARHIRKGATFPSVATPFSGNSRWFGREEATRNNLEGFRVVLRMP